MVESLEAFLRVARLKGIACYSRHIAGAGSEQEGIYLSFVPSIYLTLFWAVDKLEQESE